jgi:hypothetical protein
MRRKTPGKATIAIRAIVEEKGKGIKVQLVSGHNVWLPASISNIRTDDYGGRLVEIPAWLKCKIDKQLQHAN